MTFYEYLSQFNLNDFNFLSVIVRKAHDDFDWIELEPVIAIATYDFDLVFDLHEIFDNFCISNIFHSSSSGSLYIMVSIYE